MIPDPMEIMERQIEDRCWEWDELQTGVKEGWYKCPACKELFDWEPISVSADPTAPVTCGCHTEPRHES